MLIRSDGRIAYHAYLFREDGGTDFVQYGFDGKVLYRVRHSVGMRELLRMFPLGCPSV